MNVPLNGSHVNASHDSTHDPVRRRLQALKKAAHYVSVQDREAAHRALATSLSSHGINREHAAAGAGVTKTMVDRWRGGDDNGHAGISIDRLLTIGHTSERGREAARSVLLSLLALLDPTPEPAEKAGA